MLQAFKSDLVLTNKINKKIKEVIDSAVQIAGSEELETEQNLD